MKLDLITNNAENRKDNDEFYTPEYAIKPLLKYLNPSSRILCPFDTNDSLFKSVLNKHGHFVTNSHLDMGKDFFSIDDVTEYDYIISNPPYSLKYEVFSHLFKLNKPFAMLVGVVGLFESQKRFEMFANNKFEVMYFNKRISYFKDYSDKVCKLNPPFSSVYITHNILPSQIVFETINKNYDS